MKSEYGTVTLKKEFKMDLKEEATKEGLTVPAFLQVLLTNHMNKKL